MRTPGLLFSREGNTGRRHPWTPLVFSANFLKSLDDRAVLTLEDMVSLGKIGGSVVRQIRALEKILLGWVDTDDL